MRRVLAVDDDPSILAVIKDILTKSGYTVNVVPNGVEALRLGSTPSTW
jgi:CheY-like chemotaxis protein